jgi:hypothetical protein
METLTLIDLLQLVVMPVMIYLVTRLNALTAKIENKIDREELREEMDRRDSAIKEYVDLRLVAILQKLDFIINEIRERNKG